MRQSNNRPGCAALGIQVGVLPRGNRNSIADVSGVGVGHTTLVAGPNICTGVTAIMPHEGNVFAEKVPGAIFVGNGFGKLLGSTQVNELGEIETPIVLTSTLCAPRAADAVIEYVLSRPGNEHVRSVNPVVGETNDGFLNDIRGRHIRAEHVFAAIEASSVDVEEGNVGAGTGTVAFGFKGGIGTASRKLPDELGGHTVGALVQSNYGGIFTMVGVPVGIALKQCWLREYLSLDRAENREPAPGGGSIMVVIATDAPLDHHGLYRLAARGMTGIARTGSNHAHESGEYIIAFSTAPGCRMRFPRRLNPDSLPAFNMHTTHPVAADDALSVLFLAAIEATEEAIYNSMLRANTTYSNGRNVSALPLDLLIPLLRRHGIPDGSAMSGGAGCSTST